MSRDRLLGFFWPDSDEVHGRHSLRQALYVLRQEIGRDVVRSHEAVLVLDGSAISSDIAAFRAAVAADDLEGAVGLAQGSFLDAFYLPGAPAFERWVEDERARLTVAVTGALGALASAAAGRRDRDAAVEWCRQLTVADPLSGGFAVRYLEALAARGDRARALAFIRQHEAHVRRELDAEPDPGVRRIEARLRAQLPAEVVAAGPEVAQGGGPTTSAVTTVPTAPVESAPNAELHEPVRWRPRRAARIAASAALLGIVITPALVRRASQVPALEQRSPVGADRAIANERQPITAGSSVVEPTTSSPVARRLYQEGLQAYAQFNLTAAQQLMRAALKEDSTFAMAAYYDAKLVGDLGSMADGRAVDARSHALRLAERAPERERLTILADLLRDNNEPRALAIAESLAARHADDSRALIVLASARGAIGDWAGAAQAIERAIVLDSVAEPAKVNGDQNCRLCDDMARLMDLYFWWDSLPAVERVGQRFANARPGSTRPYYTLSIAAARRGDSAATYAYYRQMSASGTNRVLKFRLDLTLEAYGAMERDVGSFLSSSFPGEWQGGAWNYLIALRNQGRLRDALQLHRTGQVAGLPAPTIARQYDGYNEAILAFERGDARRAADEFGQIMQRDMSRWASGIQARHRAWNGTLQGMALAAAGDTFALRRLADSVERWGSASLYGRDRRAHHYLRGLLLAAEGRHEAAVRAYREAIFSPSLGFTRVNYELARCLLRLGRASEAIPPLQSALHGEVDASNLYITRTELHELLAQAFAAVGATDSAATHYRAVSRAWEHADPVFHTRRAAAQRWLARHSGVIALTGRRRQP